MALHLSRWITHGRRRLLLPRFGDTTFHLSKKKILDSGDPFPIKLFFSGCDTKRQKN